MILKLLQDQAGNYLNVLIMVTFHHFSKFTLLMNQYILYIQIEMVYNFHRMLCCNILLFLKLKFSLKIFTWNNGMEWFSFFSRMTDIASFDWLQLIKSYVYVISFENEHVLSNSEYRILRNKKFTYTYKVCLDNKNE